MCQSLHHVLTITVWLPSLEDYNTSDSAHNSVDWKQSYGYYCIKPVEISTGNCCGYQHHTWPHVAYFAVIHSLHYTLARERAVNCSVTEYALYELEMFYKGRYIFMYQDNKVINLIKWQYTLHLMVCDEYFSVKFDIITDCSTPFTAVYCCHLILLFVTTTKCMTNVRNDSRHIESVSPLYFRTGSACMSAA
jgi:hypothetical protein